MPIPRMFQPTRILAGLIAAAAVSGCSLIPWTRQPVQSSQSLSAPQDGYAVSRPLPCNDYPVSYRTYAAGNEGRSQVARPQPLSPEQRSAVAKSILDSCAQR